MSNSQGEEAIGKLGHVMKNVNKRSARRQGAAVSCSGLVNTTNPQHASTRGVEGARWDHSTPSSLAMFS